MQINIESLNKEVFKIALNEEIERQSFNQKMIKNQISEGIRFDGDEELVEELDRLKKSFNDIILFVSYKSIFDITDEEFMFLERMIKNQTCISNSRLEDWAPDGKLANYFKLRSKGDFENNRLKMIKYDEDIKECMKQLSKILDIEFED